MGFAQAPAEGTTWTGATRTRATDSPMPHSHAPALRADAAPRPQAAPFSLLRVGLAPRLAVAGMLAAALWALIGWAIA